MKIAVASDHAGFSAKESIKKYLSEIGVEVLDIGTYSEQSCDYPDFAEKCAASVLSGEAEKGILVCGTGIGMDIAANKIKGIRCAHVTNEFSATMSREHNDANIMAMGARITPVGDMLKFVKIFISTPFSAEEKHMRRLEKINKLELNG